MVVERREEGGIRKEGYPHLLSFPPLFHFTAPFSLSSPLPSPHSFPPLFSHLSSLFDPSLLFICLLHYLHCLSLSLSLLSSLSPLSLSSLSPLSPLSLSPLSPLSLSPLSLSQAVGRAFSEELVLHPGVLRVLSIMDSECSTNMTNPWRKMALVPTSTKLHLVKTDKSIFSYILFAVHNVHCYPGVPSLLKKIFRHCKVASVMQPHPLPPFVSRILSPKGFMRGGGGVK